MNEFMAYVGRSCLHFVAFVANLFLKLPSDINIIFRSFFSKNKIFKNLFAKEVYHSGVKSLLLMLIIGVGVSSVFMQLFPFERFRQGAENIYGGIFAVLIIRELVPLVTLVIISVRSTIYITIQIAQMKIGGEIRSLEIMGVDPSLYLGSMRVLAGMLICPFLASYFALSAIMSGAFTAWSIYQISPLDFIVEVINMFSFRDLLIFLFKLIFSGYVIYKIAIYNGLNVANKRNAIISRTIRAITQSVSSVIIIDFAASVVFYG